MGKGIFPFPPQKETKELVNKKQRGGVHGWLSSLSDRLLILAHVKVSVSLGSGPRTSPMMGSTLSLESVSFSASCSSTHALSLSHTHTCSHSQINK